MRIILFLLLFHSIKNNYFLFYLHETYKIQYPKLL